MRAVFLNWESQTEKGQPLSPERRIADLASDIQKSGLTTGKATIAAQTLYQTAQQYGPNAEAMLAAYEPGQDPKRFASGFQNAYILGTLGEKDALSDSKAATYLTPGQRETAYEMGAASNAGRTTPGKDRKGKKGLSAAADGRDDLENIPIRAVTPIAQGFSAFPKDDILYERSKRIMPDGDKYDVAMHGSSHAVALGTAEANTSPRLLAQIIMHDKNYRGQDIRLLACNTGYSANGEYCFAEELANALGVTVWAPNDLLYISSRGKMSVGKGNTGSMVPFQPNERGRVK